MSTAGREVWVYSERDDLALELLAPGRKLADQLGGPLGAIVTGEESRSRADRFRAGGADGTLAVRCAPEEPRPGPEGALEMLASVVALERVAILLVGATADGTEVAARLAQRLGVACASDCLELDAAGGSLVVERRCYGRFHARQRLASRPAIATVPARRFEPLPVDAARPGTIEFRDLGSPTLRTRWVETVRRSTSDVSVGDASAVVGVGRGLRRREDLPIVEELAAALGGVVVATRPLTDDLRWLPTDRKVGLSGATIRPELYVACGISGQIEHVVGMRDSRIVVAINTDPQAPIMREADLCVVGDLYRVVPALTRAIRRVV